jgi:death-on-curing protein
VYLTEKDVAYAVHSLAQSWFKPEDYGEPMPRFELRGREGLALFESAVAQPRHPYLRTKHVKAAALFRSLIKNHSLIDGNKRIAVVALSTFLIVNRVDFKVPQDQIVEAALAVASYPGNFPLEVLERWIRAGCVGRPKSIVREMAETWPDVRKLFTAVERTADIRYGRPVRIPGRRVRLPPEFWERAREIVEGAPRTPIQQRLFDL